MGKSGSNSFTVNGKTYYVDKHISFYHIPTQTFYTGQLDKIEWDRIEIFSNWAGFRWFKFCDCKDFS